MNSTCGGRDDELAGLSTVHEKSSFSVADLTGSVASAANPAPILARQTSCLIEVKTIQAVKVVWCGLKKCVCQNSCCSCRV